MVGSGVLTVFIFQLLHTLCCAYALIWGGKPERLAGAMLFTAAMATVLVEISSHYFNYRDVELATLLIDAALLAGLVSLALKANRYWPIWISALHASTVTTHLVKFMNPVLLPTVYHIAAAVMAIPMAMLLVVAAYRHQQRMKLSGTDSPWSDFSGRLILPQLSGGPQR